MSKFNEFQTLLTAAEAYYYLGYAVIPLLGDFDPTRPKVAVRSWSAYQQRLATLTEFNDWFSPQGGAAALGIVTGRISRLVVLDFDSPDLFADFRRRCPDLLETRTVQSAGRGLPHLYFHLPSHLRLASHKRPGVDLLSDGRYVVAPPTQINGQAYAITRGGMPRPLTAHDIQRLQSFLTASPSTPYIKEDNLAATSLRNGLASNSDNIPVVGAGLLPPDISSNVSSPQPSFVGKGLRPFLSPISTNIAPSTSPTALSPLCHAMERRLGGEVSFPTTQTNLNTLLASSPRPEGEGSGVRASVPSRANLHTLYQYWRSKGGRNEALFRTALYARDHGLDESQTRRALSSLHVSAPALSPLSHAMERGRGGEEALPIRQHEAYATIHSAFTRPPRQIAPSPRPAAEGHRRLGEGLGVRAGIPNTVREALMQHKHTHVVRTLEGLYQAGFRPGRGFSTDQAIQSLKGIVGRDSVYNALNALAPNGHPYFTQRSPSALPSASKEAAKHKQHLKTKKCFFVTEKKSGVKKRGPKQRLFKFPQLSNLCKLLGVKTSGSDPLTRDDLTSARQTRMALHRELIKRRPAEYTRRWLANRLGVSRRTINTYNGLIPIHTRPTYHETGLSWSTIDNLLTDEILAGAFIETLAGKKYPALLSIAKHLLAKGTYIRLKQRTGNLYWYGSDDPPPNILPTYQSVEPPSRQERQDFSQQRDYQSQPYPKMKEWNEPPKQGDQKKRPGDPVGTRHITSAVMHRLPSPRPEGEGLGMRAVPPLPPDQQESLAQTIYTRVNQNTDGKTRQLSLKNARKLVKTHTEKNINFALQRLSQRTNLANPSGFFVTVLRSTARQT